MKILLIEDDPGIIKLMTKALIGLNHEVIHVELGKDAIETIRENNFDLMLLDYRLQDYDAETFVKDIQGSNLDLPPFIVTTGGGDERIAVRMMKLGARDYIVKDYEFWELFPRVINRVEKELYNEKKIIEAKIRLNETSDLLVKTQSLAKLGSWQYDLLSDELFWSDEVYNIFGLTDKSIRLNQKMFHDLVYPEDLERVKEAYDNSIENKQNGYEVEHRIIRQNDKQIIYVYEKCEHHYDSSGNVIKSLGMIQDITERKLSEEKLKISEEKFRALYDNAPLAYQSLNNEGEFIDVNKHWLNTLGYGRDEVIGKSFSEFWPDEFKKEFPKKFQELKKVGCKHNLHLKLKRKSGEIIDTLYEAQVGYWPDGKFRQTYCVFKDITEQKKIEDELKISEDRFSLAMKAANNGLFDWKIKEDEVYYSTEWKSILGYEESELENKFSVWEELTHPEDVKSVMNKLNSLFAQKETDFEYEIRMKHKNGSWIDILVRGDLFYDEVGDPERMIGIHIDLTEIKKIERELRESDERYNQAINATEDGIFDWDLVTNKIYYSPNWKKMLGYEDDELVNDFSVWEKLTHPDDVKSSWEILEKHLAKELDRFEVEFRMKHKDGHWVEILSRANAIFNQEGKAIRVVGTHVDVTEKNKVQRELLNSEGKYKLLFDNASLGIGYFSVDGTVISWNKTAIHNMGGVPEDYIGKNIVEIFGEEQGFIFKERLELAAKSETNIEFEDEIITSSEKRWFLSTISRINDYDGKVSGIQIISNDITERKIVENLLKDLIMASSKIGQEFYEYMALKMASTLNADYSLIGKLSDEKIRRIKTVAVCADNKIIDNIEYDLEGTPCDNVVGNKVCLYPNNIIEKFPEDKLLVEMGVKGYLGVPLFDSKKNAVGIIAVLYKNEITDQEFYKSLFQIFSTKVANEIEREAIAEELLRREELLTETQKISKVGGWQYDVLTGNMSWTDETFRIHGVERPSEKSEAKELIAKSLECYEANDRDKIFDAFNRCVEEGIPYDYECHFNTYDKRKIIVRTTAKAIEEKNKIVKVIGNIMDITELKKLESEIEKFFNQSLNLNLIGDSEGNILRVNKSCEKILGYKAEELINKNIGELIHPDDLNQTIEEFGKIFSGQATQYFINRYKRKDGEYITLAWSASADITEKLAYGTAVDITDKYHLDKINNSRLHLYKFAVEHNLDDLLEETLNELEKLTDSKIGFFHFIEDDQVNLRLQNWSTNTKEKFCSAKGQGEHSPIDQAGVWVDCVKTKKPIIHNDYEALEHKKGMPEGHAKVIRELVVPVVRGNKIKAILGIGNKEINYTDKDVEMVKLFAEVAYEIVEKKKMEENLSVLSKAVSQTPLSIIITDKKGKITYVNDYFYQKTGYSSEEVIGSNPEIINSGSHVKNFHEDLWNTIYAGKVWQGEVCNKKKNGEIYWENVIINPVYNDKNEIDYFISVQEDITEKKRSDEELLDKMSKLEKFNNSMVDRELRMIELKREVNELLEKLGHTKKYRVEN